MSSKIFEQKVFHFGVDNYDSLCEKQRKIKKEGRWTLKEHIQFLQALDKIGINWKKFILFNSYKNTKSD